MSFLLAALCNIWTTCCPMVVLAELSAGPRDALELPQCGYSLTFPMDISAEVELKKFTDETEPFPALEEGEYRCYLQRRDGGTEQTPGPQSDGALLKTSARSKRQLVRTEVMQLFLYDAGAAVALWILET
ncbi:unnamed protein product [Bubo scandiacus]